MTSGNHTIIDIGEMVLCDLCNADYTDSEAEGGILMGTYSICPTCAPGVIRERSAPASPSCCPAQTRFKDWVLQLRGGRNTIEITSSERECLWHSGRALSSAFSCSAFHLGLCRSATARP